MLDVRRLRVLREVARHRSLSGAAAALAYTPSAVSQQIGALERELGVRLVVRHARGVALTEEGREMIAHATEILGRLEALEERMRAIHGLRVGRVRLAAFSSAAASIVPRAVVAFRDRYPRIELTLAEMEPDEAFEQLRQREVDVAVVYDCARIGGASSAGIEYHPLVGDQLYVGLPRDHRFAEREVVPLRDLAGEPWVRGVYRGSSGSALAAAFAAAGFEPNVVFRSDDHLAVQGFVAAGLGVAVMPGLTRETLRHDIVARPLEIDGRRLSREIGAATVTPYPSPAAVAMIGVLQDICEPEGEAGAIPLANQVAKVE